MTRLPDPCWWACSQRSPYGDIVASGSSEDNTTGAVDIALARYLG